MITGILISLINIVNVLVSFLPKLTVRIPSEIINISMDVFNGVGYFIPKSALTILTITISVNTFIFSYNTVAEMRDWTPILW